MFAETNTSSCRFTNSLMFILKMHIDTFSAASCTYNNNVSSRIWCGFVVPVSYAVPHSSTINQWVP